MKPLRDVVLIKVDPYKDRTESGLYITESWKTLPSIGTVVAIGPQVTGVKPNDRVQFERYASVILENDNRLCQESHILAVLEDE